MTEIDPKDSVQIEQFGETENKEKKTTREPKAKSEKAKSESASKKKPSAKADTESIGENKAPVKKKSTTKKEATKAVESEVSVPETEIKDTPVELEEKKVSKTTKKPNAEIDVKDNPTIEELPADVTDTNAGLTVSESTTHEKSIEGYSVLPPNIHEIDYTDLSKEELVTTLRKYFSEYTLEAIKDHVEAIKSVFYKKFHTEIDAIHAKYLEEGGNPEDFKVEESPVDINMKELLNIYREKRNEISRSMEDQKEINLQEKLNIIEAIKELINSQESLNKTFHDFRALQEKWREIGPIPQKNVKDLWESYHYHVEAFYDYIKINKELRDLDFKRNLDAKIALCEKAEELLIEPSVVEAFRKLQILHEQWREIGPVPAEKRNEIWERFRDATSKINHRHQDYFVNLKDEQKNNLEEKNLLCEKAESLAEEEIESAKDWEEKSRELIELQKIWKSIGFAPKKYNTKVYERFRAACDKFFDKKREYFAQNREEQENNLQLKTELCMQAEAMQNSTQWKKTTDDLIRLQKRWKAIGPVPLKQSDKIWKRFRVACDAFFNNKAKYFDNIDSKYEENLKLKEDLILQIENFQLSDDENKNLEQLKEFQRLWSEIGFVPLKQKDAIQEKYRETINNKFDELKVDDDKKTLLKFRNRVESIASKPNADKRLDMERDKCFNKLKQLESDISLWENNIGFFSNSKNAKSMITDVEQKIKFAKLRIEVLQEKINIIDEFI